MSNIKSIQAIVDLVIGELNEFEEGPPEGFREYYFDSLASELSEEDDPDAFDLVFSNIKPKSDLSVIIGHESLHINRAESYQDNTLGREWNETEINLVSSMLPKHTKYLWSTDKRVAFQSSKFKGLKPWLVSRPGYTGPEDAPPTIVDAELSNGYKVMVLTDSNEVKTEGRSLKHCVGRSDMRYINSLISGNIKLYSLRDPDGEALLTIEQRSDGSISQISGKKNRYPGFGCGSDKFTKPQEVRALLEWLKLKKIDVNSVQSLNGAMRHI